MIDLISHHSVSGCSTIELHLDPLLVERISFLLLKYVHQSYFIFQWNYIYNNAFNYLVNTGNC